MGSYLSSPITQKYSHSGSYELGNERENKKLVYAVSEMQGWRKTMEDAHIALCNLEKTYDVPAGTSLFAVFDGHAGREVSAFCQQHFVAELLELESFKAGAYREALVECFHKMDDMLRDPRYHHEISDLKSSSPSRSESLIKVVTEDETEFEDTDSMDEKISKRGSREFEDESEGSLRGNEIDLNALEKLEDEVGENVEKQRAESVNLNFMKESLQDAIRNEKKKDDPSSPVRNEATAGNGSSPSAAGSQVSPNGLNMPDHVKQQMEAANAKGSISKNEALDLMLQMLKFSRKANKGNANGKADGLNQLVENGSPAETAKVDVSPLSDFDFPTIAGCTAIVALIINGKIYVANAGDSRGVLCTKLLSKPTGKHSRNNNSGFALSHPLSFDHKPLNPTERTRIEKAGGFVTDVGRICGNLNLSRSIGDLKYKTNDSVSRSEQIITAEPDVTITDIKKEDLFFILACDGVWDILTNEGIVEFIKEKLLEEEERNCEKIIESIFTRCLSIDPLKTQGLGGDNMTCILVMLKPIEEVIAGLRESI